MQTVILLQERQTTSVFLFSLDRKKTEEKRVCYRVFRPCPRALALQLKEKAKLPLGMKWI
jgi:hypothetical protein